MEQFSIWAFLAGLALFVYGMNLLEDSIKDLWYKQLKKWLTHMVNTRMKAIFAWTVLAGILQSWTIVSTMVIAFAGAWLLWLTSGIGVIIGWNVWWTFLGVIITKLWFWYSISTWALPLLAVWGLMQFIKHERRKTIGKLILWFWLLLFGIGYLKDSVDVLAATIDVSKYASMAWYVFFLWGILLALLLHSSGTATIIAMTAMVGWIISFEQAIIAMLWASIWSSLISLYVSLWGSPIKRQIAYTHVWFNVLGALLFLPFAWWADEIMWFFMTNNTSPDAIAWFQVLYNTIAAILIFPFIKPLASLMERMVKWDDTSDYTLLSISEHKQKKYLPLLDEDILVLMKKIFKFNLHHLGIDQKILLDPMYTISEKYYAEYTLEEDKFVEDYEILKTIEEALLKWLLQRLHTWNDKEDKQYLPFYQSINALMYSAKALDDTRHNVMNLSSSENLMVKERLHTLKEHMVDLYITLSKVIDKKSYVWQQKNVQKHLDKIEHANEVLIDLLWKHLHRQPMAWWDLSWLLHFTSALMRSHRSFVKWLEELWNSK